MTTNWAVGHNMPGYMPDGEVFITDLFESAVAILREDLKRHADQIAEELSAPEREVGRLEDAERAVNAAIAELNAAEVGDFLAYVDDYAYWINATDEAAETE